MSKEQSGQYPDPEAIRQKRIAELERERAVILKTYGDGPSHTAYKAETVRIIDAELSRLRNEQPKGGDAATCAHGTDDGRCLFDERKWSGGAQAERCDGCPDSSPSPEPQDVRAVGWRRRWQDRSTGEWGKWSYDHAEMPPYEGPHKRDDVQAEPLYTAPPRADASGAAEIADREADACDVSVDATADQEMRAAFLAKANTLRNFARFLRSRAADGLRLPPPNREHIARTLWESQRARIHNQDGINARLSWRDKSVPFRFWEHYELDADAVIAALASAQQEPAPAADAEDLGMEICTPNFLDKIATEITNRLAFEFGLTADGMADVHGICQEEMAALRQYAGDSGVTDEMVEAAWLVLPRCEASKEQVRAALEAAARAKSGEKGGAR